MQTILNQETIVAIATPAGKGAIGIIRLSGNKSIGITDEIFVGKNLSKQATHTLHYGQIKDDEHILDDVVVSLFKGQQSYTKEEVVEISCHGSDYILQSVLKLCLKKGARLANPGEFTLRAFLNGRFDLSQAEAVADLIAADSEAAHDLAIQQMRGGFSKAIQELRADLIHFASMIELELDFSEEDVAFADMGALLQLIEKIERKIKPLAESFDFGNAIKNGVPTVIVGRPNAGKSTLLNALLQEERAIVSEIAGTTRDTIEEVKNIDGVAYRLIDTAGIREAQDQIEKIGVQKSLDKAKQATLLIYVFDDLNQLSFQKQEIIVLANKMDLVDDAKIESLKTSLGNQFTLLCISALSIDLNLIEECLSSSLMQSKIGQDNTIVSNIRHLDALNKSLEALDQVKTGIQNGLSGEFLSIDIKSALHQLGLISGEVTTDDLLANIFSKFCIGK
ncbi:UNVERIFIED_CONTAM: hypothetical protein GTU68_052034 [Idotea baltica]|nr:hypothetical protein [Idotea baltica]